MFSLGTTILVRRIALKIPYKHGIRHFLFAMNDRIYDKLHVTPFVGTIGTPNICLNGPILSSTIYK